MTKMEFRKKRKAVGEVMEGEGSKGTTTRVDEGCTSGSTSSGDRLRGEKRSKSREDPALRWSTACMEGGKGKGLSWMSVWVSMWYVIDVHSKPSMHWLKS